MNELSNKIQGAFIIIVIIGLLICLSVSIWTLLPLWIVIPQNIITIAAIAFIIQIALEDL